VDLHLKAREVPPALLAVGLAFVVDDVRDRMRGKT
jgi:hypothetical protein